ncbi:BppU family phage baseplate upper protein [Enterococcus faecium]|uniref:BppU family phage baseplate upper protein n=1 Tax=Enterococcus faecium TaxID=1352 RepID=UPI00391C52F7
MVYKMNESIIVIQAEATNPNRTDVVFWSHDRGTAKLRMKLVRKNGIPQSLPEGTTVPIRLMFRSTTAEGGYGKHDYLATIEDPVNGIVSIVLEDNILGYVGTVEGSVYIDFPNDRSLDTAGRFTFYIKRSPIDDSTPELEDYYFNGFSQTIDKIEKILADGKQEIDQKIAESETQIDAKLKDTSNRITKANQDVATINTNIDKANARIDQTNQQIGDLGKLKRMYSNSIDFGDYDYSGNPNIAPNVGFSKFSGNGITMTKPLACFKDHETYLELDSSDPSAVNTSRSIYVPNCSALLPNNTYIMTVPIMINADFDDFRTAFTLKTRDGTALGTINPPRENIGKWQNVTKVFTVPGNLKVDTTYLQLWQPVEAKGKIYIGYDIKIEKVTSTSDTATPYQPNLLDAPYYLSKVALGENIADPTTVFPISTSNYLLYNKRNIEKYEAGQTYTLTMKATKPATQSFTVFIRSGTQLVGTMTPVEGKVDEWKLTFTVSQEAIDAGTTDLLQVYQVPTTSVGAVQIDWLKIEKGNTRTPNISQFKYFGEGLKDSNNPNDYSWDVTPEYTEKGLNDSVSLTEPQSIDGTKNFLETPMVNGEKLLTNTAIPFEAWYVQAAEIRPASNGSKLPVGRELTTIGKKNKRSMKSNPLNWSSDQLSAEVVRDCTLLIDGTVVLEFGGTSGSWAYVEIWNGIDIIGEGYGAGISQQYKLWYRNGIPFSRYITLKAGTQLSIGVSMPEGTSLTKAVISHFHVMEIDE